MKTLLYSLLTYFMFTSSFLLSQERELFHGRIEIDLEGESPEGIEIINITSSQKVTTDLYGYFELPIQLHDILHIYSNDFEERRYTITSKNMESKKVVIHLNIEPNMIEEVVVNQLKFTGNLAKDVKNNRDHLKSYKQQQIVAKVKPTDLSTGQLAPINISQGYRSKFKLKTAAQKKRIDALAYRGEVETQLQIQHYFNDDFYTNTLHIPQEEIQSFIMYCYTKSNLKELAETNQFTKIQLKLIDLAPQYIAQMKSAQNDQSYIHSSLLFHLS